MLPNPQPSCQYLGVSPASGGRLLLTRWDPLAVGLVLEHNLLFYVITHMREALCAAFPSGY